MMNSQNISEEDLIYAGFQVKEASDRLNRVKERVYLSDDDPDPEDITVEDVNKFTLQADAANVILDLQLSIELSVKSMFIALGIKHPESHDITFNDDSTEGVLENIPEDFDDGDGIPRAIFLTQFWHRFYELTKYGVPELGIKPIDIINREDAKKAIKDAEYCVEIANNLIEYQTTEYDVTVPSFRLGY